MPDRIKQRSRTKTHRSPKAFKPDVVDQASTGSAGGRAATLESTPVASTPADPVDEPVKRRRRGGKAAAAAAELPEAAAAASVSADLKGDPEKLVEDVIIRQKAPAVDVILEESHSEELPAGSQNVLDRPEQGIAQSAEHVVRNGGDTGSRPVPLIEPLRGNSNGDATHMGVGSAPRAVTPSAGGAPEVLSPIFSSATDLEKIVVGTAMRYPARFPQLATIIRKPEVFHAYANQCVWRVIAKLEHEGSPIDPVLVADKLRDMNLLGDVTAPYIIDLWNSASSLSVEHHAELLVDRFLKRQIASWSKSLGEKVANPSSSPIQLIQEAKIDLERLGTIKFAANEEDNSDKVKRYVSFPVEILPTTLQDFVLAASEALGCDPAFVAVPCLVAVGAAIGNSRVVALKETWLEPAVFWAAVVADSSSLKSPAMDAAMRPLLSIQETLSMEFEENLRRWKSASAEFTSTRYSSDKMGGTGQPSLPPDKPVPRKVLVNDITIERLAQVMYQNPHGVCLYRDELSGWFGSFSRYAESKGPGADVAQWLEMFRAKTMIIDRKGGDPPSLYIKRAACSVIGTIQPRVLAKLLRDDFFDSGMASRLLLCMPPRTVKVWTEATIPLCHYNTYNNIINNIYLDSNDIRVKYDTGQKQIGFSKSGKAAWVDFFTEWADLQKNACGEQSYALSKLEAYCARFCLLIACCEKADNTFRDDDITDGHVHRAVKLVKWFAGEIERVYSMIRTPAEKNARNQLVEWIKSLGGRVTPRRLQRSNASRYPNAKEALKPMDALVSQGLAKWITIPSEETGGAPGRALELIDSSAEFLKPMPEANQARLWDRDPS